MFKREAPQPTELALAINTAAVRFRMTDDPAYATRCAADIKLLSEAQATLWEAQKPRGVSKDVLAPVVGNLVGIMAILSHERMNVITTKAMSLIIKPKA
jgi:hypothetical protein